MLRARGIRGIDYAAIGHGQLPQLGKVFSQVESALKPTCWAGKPVLSFGPPRVFQIDFVAIVINIVKGLVRLLRKQQNLAFSGNAPSLKPKLTRPKRPQLIARRGPCLFALTAKRLQICACRPLRNPALVDKI